VLPATRQRWHIPALTPAEAGTWLSDPGGMQGWVDLVHVIPMAVARSSQVATQGVESAVNNSMLRMAAAQSVFLWWRCDMRFRFYGWRYICTYNGQEGGVGLYAYGTINWTMNISPKADWLLACCVSGQFSVRYRPTKGGWRNFVQLWYFLECTKPCIELSPVVWCERSLLLADVT